MLKIADIDGHKIMHETFIFINSKCESTYTDNSELGEDLISLSIIEENMDDVTLTPECAKELKRIMKQATKRDCGYIRIVE